MAWWLWIGIGLGLLSLELFAPTGFFMALLGGAAVIVGALAFFEIAGSENVQWILFVGLSGVLVVLARRKLMTCIKAKSPATGVDIAGSDVLISGDIPAGAFGQGELRGSTWTVHNQSSTTLRGGSRMDVTEVDGVTLIIRD